MTSVDFGNYKRIVQAFWDPEPKNDDPSGSDIWCLGTRYPSEKTKLEEAGTQKDEASCKSRSLINGVSSQGSAQQTEATSSAKNDTCKSTDEGDSTWPSDFLDDCEARMWFTYRSAFPPIKKSPEASMTLSVRLRSLGDQGGFTSDTGWGCMIRSGQTLLANAMSNLRLGRGKAFFGRLT